MQQSVLVKFSKFGSKQLSCALVVDASWCVSNKENLSVMAFARQFKHTNQIYCHSRYKTIVENHTPQTLHWTEFWKGQKRLDALSEADTNCSDAINKFLVENSKEVLVSVDNFHEPTTAGTIASPSVISDTPTSAAAAAAAATTTTSAEAATTATPAEAVTNTTSFKFAIDFSNNELDLEHCILGGSVVTTFFQQYQNHADKIPKPITLETSSTD
ncbi:hypothetical protein INT46_004256 [Mucor plumbeus]|uniref:Uncharacterized protein n=1 Tax=Mucor plumbeus TaxID=97098 RepID=A0A8H7QY68_9FUNG|nr:hypothetical protein INT46_004256 [Mucor plumbeus]